MKTVTNAILINLNSNSEVVEIDAEDVSDGQNFSQSRQFFNFSTRMNYDARHESFASRCKNLSKQECFVLIKIADAFQNTNLAAGATPSQQINTMLNGRNYEYQQFSLRKSDRLPKHF